MNHSKATQVKLGLKKYFWENYGVVPDFFMADHNHEEIREGSWSIAWEGWEDEYGSPWAYCIPERAKYDIYGIPDDVFLEPIIGCILGVHDRGF